MKPVDLLTKPFSRLAYVRARSREASLGYLSQITHMPQGWINGTMLFDMTPVWKKHGIPAVGVTRFTIGSIENDVSIRFTPESEYFQAWFGCYIMKFNEHRKWSIEDHCKLGEADQLTWLSLYGDPSPLAEIKTTNIKLVGKIQLGKYSGQLFQCGGLSHSDVGNGNSSILYPFYMAGLADTINQSNSQLRLCGYNFSPIWHKHYSLKPFEGIWLEGYVAIIDIADDIKAVAFGNGVRFKDRLGKTHDTFRILKGELLKMIKSISIAKC